MLKMGHISGFCGLPLAIWSREWLTCCIRAGEGVGTKCLEEGCDDIFGAFVAFRDCSALRSGEQVAEVLPKLLLINV